MPTVTVGQENSSDIEIYYEDHGAGQPVVLIHGYPLSGRAWDKQVPALLEAGHRVITYDRRGFGQSSQPATGYDYDTFAADLSMPCWNTWTCATPCWPGTRWAPARSPATWAATARPGWPRACSSPRSRRTCCRPATTPTGCRKACSTGSPQAARADTPAWMKGFLDNFYNFDTLRGTLVSDQAWQASWNLAVTASATAAVACIGTWTTDFRDDLPKIDVPMLVLHGDADQVLPLDKTASRLPALIKDVQLIVVEGGPHAIPWTHADQVNTALLDFIRS